MKSKYKNYENAGLPIFDLAKDGIQYINYFNVKDKKGKDKLVPFFYDSLTEALGDIINEGFYYAFNVVVMILLEDGSMVESLERRHEHDFGLVVRSLFLNPVGFSIDDADKNLYSEQEYHFLMKLQSYLLISGRENLGDADIAEINAASLKDTVANTRNYGIKTFAKDNIASLIIDKKKKYFISKNQTCDVNKQDRYLVCDNSGKFLGLIEVVKKKVKNIEDLTEKDVDYKLEGYRSLKGLKKYLSDTYEDNEVVINTVKVIRKFK